MFFTIHLTENILCKVFCEKPPKNNNKVKATPYHNIIFPKQIIFRPEGNTILMKKYKCKLQRVRGEIVSQWKFGVESLSMQEISLRVGNLPELKLLKSISFNIPQDLFANTIISSKFNEDQVEEV